MLEVVLFEKTWKQDNYACKAEMNNFILRSNCSKRLAVLSCEKKNSKHHLQIHLLFKNGCIFRKYFR